MEPELPTSADNVDRIECPKCAEFIRSAAQVCRFCGYDLVADQMTPRSDAPAMAAARAAGGRTAVPKDPVIAGVMAVLLPGLGHIYVGRVRAGLGYLVAILMAVLLLQVAKDARDATPLRVICGVVLFGGWILQFAGAIRAAKRPRGQGQD